MQIDAAGQTLNDRQGTGSITTQYTRLQGIGKSGGAAKMDLIAEGSIAGEFYVRSLNIGIGQYAILGKIAARQGKVLFGIASIDQEAIVGDRPRLEEIIDVIRIR